MAVLNRGSVLHELKLRTPSYPDRLKIFLSCYSTLFHEVPYWLIFSTNLQRTNRWHILSPSPWRGQDALPEQGVDELVAPVTHTGWYCSGEPPLPLPVSISLGINFRRGRWTQRREEKTMGALTRAVIMHIRKEAKLQCVCTVLQTRFVCIGCHAFLFTFHMK